MLHSFCVSWKGSRQTFARVIVDVVLFQKSLEGLKLGQRSTNQFKPKIVLNFPKPKWQTTKKHEKHWNYNPS